MKRIALLALFCLAAPLWAADPPQAKLSGPKAVEVGSAIILNPTGSVGDVEFGLASGPGPAPVIKLKSDDGQTVIGFGTAAVPGTYVFVCTAWAENVPNGRPAHSFAFWTVQVGQVVPPEPPPTPPSDGALGLTKASREGAARVVPAAKSAQGPALAKAHRDLAAELYDQSKAWPADPVALSNAVLDAKRVRNKAAVTDAGVPQWLPWASAVDAQVKSLYDAGRLKTKADWAVALTEIAQGLEG